MRRPSSELSVGALILATVATWVGVSVRVEGANILFYHGVSTYSHRITVWNYIQALVAQGHNVSIFQPTLHQQKLSHPLVHDYFPPELEEVIYGDKGRPGGGPAVPQGGNYSFLNSRLLRGLLPMQWDAITRGMPERSLFICSALLDSSAGQEWIQNSSFDLVIIDGAYNECAMGLAHKWRARTILFCTSTLFSWYHEPFGVVQEASWIPDAHIAFPNPLTFGHRLVTALLPLALHCNKVWWYYPELDTLLRKGLNSSESELPPVSELEQGVSLILINSHFSEEFARALPPHVVPVGGIHLSPKTNLNATRVSLPEALQAFLDSCDPEGFILVSFGSAVRISDAPNWLRHAFFTAMGRSRGICFLWKWEGARPEELPRNVFIAEWLPQEQLLSDPRIKAFMSHGGLMSIQEALVAAVPLLLLPVFADQDYNAFRLERLRRGIRLEIGTLTAQELEAAIREIVTNREYKANMARARRLFLDRPQTPLQTALWWTEYVLRHKDMGHLKPFSMHQAWYQRRLLDVWAFLLAMVLVFISLCGWTCRRIFVSKKKSPIN